MEVIMKSCKSIFVFGILALVLAGLAGCASTGSSVVPIGNASGTASATAAGFVGDITVTITMVDGYITDAQVVGDETPSVGSVAVARAPTLIKKNNTGVLDAISGASISTAAISAAAQEALNKIVAGSN
jgi:fumarate reductase flavoprotein subunit